MSLDAHFLNGICNVHCLSGCAMERVTMAFEVDAVAIAVILIHLVYI